MLRYIRLSLRGPPSTHVCEVFKGNIPSDTVFEAEKLGLQAVDSLHLGLGSLLGANVEALHGGGIWVMQGLLRVSGLGFRGYFGFAGINSGLGFRADGFRV